MRELVLPPPRQIPGTDEYGEAKFGNRVFQRALFPRTSTALTDAQTFVQCFFPLQNFP